MAANRRASKKEVLLFWVVIIVGGLVASLIVAGIWYMNSEKARVELQKQIELQKKRWEQSDNYDDGCESNTECSACKRTGECLQCMHNCYNRYGDASSRDNPFQEKAISCHAVCWQTDFGDVPQVDFGIEIKRKK